MPALMIYVSLVCLVLVVLCIVASPESSVLPLPLVAVFLVGALSILVIGIAGHRTSQRREARSLLASVVAAEQRFYASEGSYGSADVDLAISDPALGRLLDLQHARVRVSLGLDGQAAKITVALHDATESRMLRAAVLPARTVDDVSACLRADPAYGGSGAVVTVVGVYYRAHRDSIGRRFVLAGPERLPNGDIELNVALMTGPGQVFGSLLTFTASPAAAQALVARDAVGPSASKYALGRVYVFQDGDTTPSAHALAAAIRACIVG